MKNTYEWKKIQFKETDAGLSYGYYKNGELYGLSRGYRITTEWTWEPVLTYHWCQTMDGEPFAEKWLDEYEVESYGFPRELIAEGEEALQEKYEEFVDEAKEAFGDEFVDSVIEYEVSVPEALFGLREGYYGIDEEGEVYVK